MNNYFARQLISTTLSSFTQLHNYNAKQPRATFNSQTLEAICLGHCPDLYPLIVEKQKCYEILKSFSEDVSAFDCFNTKTILALEFYPPQTRSLILFNIAEQVGMNNPERVTAAHVHHQAKIMGYQLPTHAIL